MKCEEIPCVVCKMCFLLSSKNYILFSHSRCKLRVLSLIDKKRRLCGIENGSHKGEGLSKFMIQNQPIEKRPDCEAKKELKVICEVNLLKGRLCESATYLFQWAQQRKDSIHLCCRELNIHGVTKATFIEIFKIVHADCVQTLILRNTCIEELAFLISYLRHMNSLSTLILYYITGTFSVGDFEKLDEEKIFRLISQHPTLHCLQELYVHEVSFIKGNLKEYLR